MVTHVKLLGSLCSLCVALAAGCGGAPERTSSPTRHTDASAPGAPHSDLPDACLAQPGKSEPQPLERAYTGLAANARCQGEVSAIMNHVAQDLGVTCAYCHLVPDFRAPTPRKQVANWMAAELVPALRKRNGDAVWCNDCHTLDGRGVAKILGEPRRESFAAEWMTTHLVEDFEIAGGATLHCKSCHGGNLGSPEFQPKIILTNHLPQQG